MEKECKICKKIIKGRSDKIFCSADCKNFYHKHLRDSANQAANQINEYLKRNYSILLELLGKNNIKLKVYRNILEQKKFRFKYHTHSHINSKGKTFHYIYDITWMEFSDDEVLIKKKDDKSGNQFI